MKASQDTMKNFDPAWAKTPSDLKYYRAEMRPGCMFFCRQNMKFAGDTMRNFGLRRPVEIETQSGEKVKAFELFRRRPVKHGLRSSSWFEAETLRQVWPANETAAV